MDCKTIQIGNTQYNYYEIPNPGKPKMLMLHGMMIESHCFTKIADRLKTDYHLYLLDLKGHGKSGNGTSYDESYTNDAICADLLNFQQAVIQEPFHLVGYSLGGQYSLKFAGFHAEVLKSVTIIDSAPALSLKGTFAILYAMFKTPKIFKDKNHVLGFYDARIPGLGNYMLTYCMRELGEGRYAIRYDKKNLAPSTMAKGIARTKDIWEACKKITTPTLVLRAEKSFILNEKLEKMLQESNPKIDVLMMPGMAHNFVFTHPQIVTEYIRSFTAKFA